MTAEEALSIYGGHTGGCSRYEWVWHGGPAGGRIPVEKCTCGFKDVWKKFGCQAIVEARPR